MNTGERKIKVFIIGLDGATFDLILPWAQTGQLPCFAKILKESAWGELESTFPPLTAPAWSSFMTGKSSGNHGIFDFFSREKTSYTQHLNSILDLKEEIIWNIIGDAGKKVGIVNVPFTYPPQKVNGFIITGLLTPRKCETYTCPSHLHEELAKELGEYLIHHTETYNGKNMKRFMEEQFAILSNRTRAGLYLMAKKEWDLFLLHFFGTDRIQHEFWHIHDKSHSQHDPKERDKYGDVILNYFKELDSCIKELLDHMDNDTVLVLLSDHGFGKSERIFHVNTWLMKMGLLTLRKNIKTRIKYILFQSGLTYTSVAKIILALGLGRRVLKFGRGRRQKIQEKFFLSLKDIDWTKTQAYSLGNFGQIYVNLKEREPDGIVSAGGEYERVLQSLTEKLLEVEDPTSGEKVIQEVLTKKETFGGKYENIAPDLCFITKDMKYKAFGLADFSSNKIIESAYGSTGHHKMNGILSVRKKGIVKENYRIKSAKIWDIAPTLLYMLGIPIPSDMDGKVLTDIFQPDYIKGNKIRYKKVKERFDSKNDVITYTDGEEKDVKKQLKDLGYI
jgi:predicted AlkP superfamily phosphohydrolase/phosphomutase